MSATPGAQPRLRVALVEDDRTEAERAMKALRGLGHDVEWYPTGVDFMTEVRDARHDLFLLDWALPDSEGITLINWIHRTLGRRAPIIIFSRFDDDARVVEALAAGADDYITKPTSPSVLVARISAISRRSQPNAQPSLTLEHGVYRLDGSTRQVTRDGQSVELQPKEFDLVWYLFEHRDRLLRREEILAAVWGRDKPTSARTLDTHLYGVRRKLMFAEHGYRVSNVYREGYRLERVQPGNESPD
jgi:DNA-binding response OmpR family regulator